MTNETHPLDSFITRNRFKRFLVMIVMITVFLGGSFLLGRSLGWQLFETGTMTTIGGILGAGFGALMMAMVFEKVFVVRNPTTGMFITQDVLQSLLGGDSVNVLYGPGVHIAFPWERRLEENNLSLQEASNLFTFIVQCIDGTLEGEGSFRLRPDMNNPVAFLSGVAAVAEEIKDLFVARIIEHTSGKKMQQVMSDLKGLNEFLQGFRDGGFNVEQQFGVSITDVTVSKLLPSKEVQKTLSALSEARAVKQGTAILLGMSMTEVQQRLKAGELSPAEYNHARDRFLAMSGNLEGMNINRTEIDFSVHGVTTEALKELRELAQTPAAQTAAAAMSSRAKGSKK